MSSRARILIVAAAVVVANLSGCATMKRIALNTDDVAVKQEQRKAEAVRAFETQRDFAQLQSAQARWREGNVTACRDMLSQILQRNPRNIEARLFLAEVLLSEEKYDEARPHLETALAELPNEARAQHAMGLLLEAQGHRSEALAYYQKAADLDPENEHYAMSCRAAQAPEVAEAQPPSNAVGATYDAPRAVKGSPAVENALREADRNLAGGEAFKARTSLSQAVSLAPDDPQTVVRAAVLALRYEQPDAALYLLQPAANRFSDSAALFRTLGMAHYRKGNYTQAQTALQQALSLDKSSALSYLLMGCTLEKLGQRDTAAGHFEHARRLDPRRNAQL